MFDCLIYNMVEQMALFIIENNGKTALIDTGTSSEVDSLLNYLQTIGIDHLDYIFSTHVHVDHTGGVKKLINFLKPKSWFQNCIRTYPKQSLLKRIQN